MTRNGSKPVTQIQHARQGTTTDAMRRVAEREELPPELVRDEVARGRMVIPANVNHLKRRLEPMGIGSRVACKINANIGNSAVTSSIDDELEKLHTAVHLGADTVMDLSTGGDIDAIRQAIIDASPVPIGTVPIYQAVSQKDRSRGPDGGRPLDMVEHQAKQGVDYMTIHAGVLLEYLPLTTDRITGIVQPRRVAAWRSGWSTTTSRTRCTRTSTRCCEIIAQLRRDFHARRRPAAGLPGRRQRRGPVRRAATRWAN